MRHWELLGIPPSDSAREIKRAYAKKLKTTRPDEKPKEFQALHQAYKTALQQVQNRNTEQYDNFVNTSLSRESEPDKSTDQVPLAPALNSEDINDAEYQQQDSPQEKSTSEVESIIENIVASKVVLVDEESDRHQSAVSLQETEIEQTRKAMQLARDELILSVRSVLESFKHVNNMQQWDFFTDCQYLFEEQFSEQLGEDVFALVSQFNSEQFATGNENNYHIKPHILRRLNDLFGWEVDRDYFYEQYGQQKASAIFDLLDYGNRNFNHSGTVKGAKVIHNASQYEINAIGKVFIMATVALLLLLAIAYVSF